MSAPDFYFAINAIFRYLHDTYGKEALVDYWRRLGREYYRRRIERWRQGGPQAIAADWQAYFDQEPGADVRVSWQADGVHLEVIVCPAISHLRRHRHDIVPYYCEHCDHVTGAMAQECGYVFHRTGGMGSCRQRLTVVRDATV